MSENTKMTQSFSDILSPLGEKHLQAAGRFFKKTELSHNIQTAKKLAVLPGFCDVHVHLREPGFSYKEIIKTGTALPLAPAVTAMFALCRSESCPGQCDAYGKTA